MYGICIVDLHVRTKVSESLGVHISLDVALSETASVYASVVLNSPDGSKKIAEIFIEVRAGHAKLAFSLLPGVIDLWYPVGYGQQPIYTMEVQIIDQVHK